MLYRNLYHKLSWEIVKHKVIYYQLDGNHSEAIVDSEYDRLERVYDYLSRRYKLPNTAMQVGIDLNRPSTKLVLSRLQRTNKS